MARSPMLTEEDVKRIASKVRNGNYAKIVCQSEGISEVTYYNYLKHGKLLTEELQVKKRRLTKAEKIYLLFFKSIKKAEATCEVDVVTAYKSFTFDSAGACETFLARRFAKRWTKETKIVGDTAQPVGVESTIKHSTVESQDLNTLEQLETTLLNVIENGEDPETAVTDFVESMQQKTPEKEVVDGKTD